MGVGRVHLVPVIPAKAEIHRQEERSVVEGLLPDAIRNHLHLVSLAPSRHRFRDLAHTRDTLRLGREYDALVTNHYPGGVQWLSI
jgi:hypothetical protein